MSEAKWKSIALRKSSGGLPVFQPPRVEPLPLAGKPMTIEEIGEMLAKEKKKKRTKK